MDNLIKEMLMIYNIDCETEEDLFNVSLDLETLKDPEKIVKLVALVPKFKGKYNSNALTCLHKNSLEKQKLPAINFIRQILKCNNYKKKKNEKTLLFVFISIPTNYFFWF